MSISPDIAIAFVIGLAAFVLLFVLSNWKGRAPR